MLAFITDEDDDDTPQDPKVSRPDIPTPETYREAVEDPVWGELWKEAIKAELDALIANGTWEQVVPPDGANIVTSKQE